MDDDKSWSSLDDPDERKEFIYKVYAILGLQLFITMGIIAIILFMDDAKRFAIEHWYLAIIFGLIFVFFALLLFCVPEVETESPINVIMLILATICFAIMVGILSAFLNTSAILLATGISMIVVVSVSLAAAFCPLDITGWALYLILFSLLLSVFGTIIFVMSFHFHFSMMTLLFCGFLLCLHMLYLGYDTQMILGGKRYDLSTSDYVAGALHLYLDIVTIFQDLAFLGR